MKIFWIVRQDLSCYVFLLSRIFFALAFCRFFDILREIFDFTRLVSLFSQSARSEFEHQLLSKTIQKEQSQYKKLKSEIETG